ncbi:MAG: ABC transporter substrate-binding protein [Alphaproteobacteria bacterium]|nr:ABC transporter substrate-binding protein [Alphaproteobacteria bacterium]
MRRRDVLKSTAAASFALATPNLAFGQGAAKTLKFVPHADPASLDPVWTTADITRNYSLAVYDTLYGLDAQLQPQMQMVGGERIEDGGKLWTLTLRDGLKFHDGTPVLARDCVASIKRGASRDPLLNLVLDRSDEIVAVDDKTIRIRLKKPFPLLRDALTQAPASIMPERVAQTAGTVQITETIGSGPYRFLTGERVPGAKIVFARNDAYVPRAEGVASYTAGPKIAYFDRIEWHILPDPATIAAALTNAEIEWWENPAIDLLPSLKRDKAMVVKKIDPYGSIGCLRFNHLHAPFDKAAVRRAVLSACNQDEFILAFAGAEPSIINNPCGLFSSGSPLASNVGTEAVGRLSKNLDQVKKDLAAAGYNGEKVVLLGPTSIPVLHAYSQVAADLLKRIGMNVDYQALEWGTVVQRRASKEPIDKGGWNIFMTNLGGNGNVSPASASAIRSGQAAWFGWPNMPKMETLRDQWLDAPDLASQKSIGLDMQKLLFEEAPYVPLGYYAGPTIHRNSIKDVRDGFPQMYGVKRA